MKYQLISDISSYAKAGSISDLAKFKKELVAEWVRIGVVKPFEHDVKESIIEDKQKGIVTPKVNTRETPEILELREKAKGLGIDVKPEYGLNKLLFLIDEKSKEPVKGFIIDTVIDTVKKTGRGRPKKEE
jgi:hypothetical protein